jgi:predicted acetyltransferase
MNGRQHSCFLDRPSERYRNSFLAGAAEFVREGRLDSTYAALLGYDLRKLERRFSAFVWDLRKLDEKRPGSYSGYQDRVFWLIDRDEYVGQLSVRPELGTPYLVTYGGHVGYSIRPGLRRRGYGQTILSLALRECSAMGLARLLVTCDSDNLASKKIIERNGGEFESAMKMDRRALEAEGRRRGEFVRKLRYWIDLGAVAEGAAR